MTPCPCCAKKFKKKDLSSHLLDHAKKYQDKEEEYYNLGKWAMREYDNLKKN